MFGPLWRVGGAWCAVAGIGAADVLGAALVGGLFLGILIADDALAVVRQRVLPAMLRCARMALRGGRRRLVRSVLCHDTPTRFHVACSVVWQRA